jgi:hypothetical protein
MEDKIKEILKAAGKLAEASKDVIHANTLTLSSKIQILNEALEHYNNLIFAYERES